MAHTIIVYEATAPGNEHCLFVAGLCIGADVQPRWYCSGPTAESARTRMEAFWAKEQKAYGEGPPRKPPQPVVEDPGDVI